MPPRRAVVLMVAHQTATPIEAMLTRLRQAAATALAHHLQGVAPVFLCTPVAWGDFAEIVITPPDFHFGRQLAGLIRQHQWDEVWYFGAASAPLLTANHIAKIQHHLDTLQPTVVTNNIHSADWVVFNHAPQTLNILENSARDNSLAWELRETLGYQVFSLGEQYPTLHLDLDTPPDYALVGYHPDCPPHLHAAILNTPELARIPIPAIVETLRREGSHITLMGRVAPSVWQKLNAATRAWIRVYSEERGMVANGRMARGEVQSVLGLLLQAQGMAGFWGSLRGLSEAIIFDNRVLMAHCGITPSDHDRYAADLWLPEAINDAWLREFTERAMATELPILWGGHSVVAGGLQVLIDLIKPA